MNLVGLSRTIVGRVARPLGLHAADFMASAFFARLDIAMPWLPDLHLRSDVSAHNGQQTCPNF
jgi:hypothetical protein